MNVKALSTYLGHSSIQITLDRYGHLMPGSETEAVGLVDAYLGRAVVNRLVLGVALADLADPRYDGKADHI